MKDSLPTVLVIDDQWGRPNDPMILEQYGSLHFQWDFESAETRPGYYMVEKALRAVREKAPDVVLLDISFGEDEPRLGVEILEKIRREFPLLPIIMFTSLDSSENRELVIQCMEIGANEYLEKTPSPSQMQTVLRVFTGSFSDQAIYGNSPAIRQLRASTARISFSGTANILIYGESGTGKELVAAALHRQGTRSDKPFIAKNCAYSDSQLLESELFGHSKGAFTGAVNGRRGLLEEANGGVLFLDEVADIPIELQAKLLRVLETRSFRRLGENLEIHSDFQLVCATNRAPDFLERAGRIRSDFYYRIAGITIPVPPLRERIEDVPILADLFLRRFKERGGAGYPGETFSPASLQILKQYSWPGNVRELRNVIERSLILSQDRVIQVEALGKASLPDFGEAKVFSSLPDNSGSWSRARLLSEIKMCLEAKRRVQVYKGEQWRAELMRLMYPECKAANAKGFKDLVRRLTQGPWGEPRWEEDPEFKSLITELTQ